MNTTIELPHGLLERGRKVAKCEGARRRAPTEERLRLAVRARNPLAG
jgi:hypothetical protein